MRNKIIPFNKNFHKRASSNRYELKAQISVYISRNNDRYDIDWSSPDKNMSYKDIYDILENVFNDIKKEVTSIEYKKQDIYKVEFTLLYYENGTTNIKYICNPSNISKEKLAEYLWVSLIYGSIINVGVGKKTPTFFKKI